MDDVRADALCDAEGQKCPMPVLLARRALKPLAAGQVLELRATDEAAANDVPAFCEMSGDTLLGTRREGGVLVFLIRKRAAAEGGAAP